MKDNANYLIHEDVYQELRERGFKGWGAESLDRRVAGFNRDLQKFLSLTSCYGQEYRVLEIGCGAGNMSELLVARKNFELVGVDISNTAIRWARSRFQENGLRADFYCQDLRYLSQLELGLFDLVVDTACLHCIVGSEDRTMVFSELKKSMKDSGVLFVGSMVGDPAGDLFDERSFDSQSRCQYKNGVPYRYMPTEESLERELASHGFEICHKWVNRSSHWDHCNLILRLSCRD